MIFQRRLTRYESSGCTILYQPPERVNSPPNYCETCDTELFCIIFVKAIPDKDEDGIDQALDTYCEQCAYRKLPGQTNWIVLKQYTLEELGDIYDSLNSDKDFTTKQICQNFFSLFFIFSDPIKQIFFSKPQKCQNCV